MEGVKVLAVALTKVRCRLTHTPAVIKTAVVSGGFGAKNVSKDFMWSNTVGNRVIRNVNSVKVKCIAISSNRIDAGTWKRLLTGKCFPIV